MEVKMQFKYLQIGDSFYCHGDYFLNYNYPKWCECVKIDEFTGREVDGINFMMSQWDEVTVLVE